MRQASHPLSTFFIVVVSCHGTLLGKLGDILPPPVGFLAVVTQLEDAQLP